MMNRHDEVYKYIGQRINHYRKIKDVSIEQLAAGIHKDVGYLENVEAGLKEIGLDELMLCANELKIPMDCVMGDLLEYKSNTADLIDLSLLISSISESDRKLYAEFAVAMSNLLLQVPKQRRKKFLELFQNLIQNCD